MASLLPGRGAKPPPSSSPVHHTRDSEPSPAPSPTNTDGGGGGNGAPSTAAAAPAPSPSPTSSSSASAAASATDKLKRIGDWVFGETLGQGSFGKVKLAHHAKTKEKVAIKIVDKSGIANVEDVERVYRETFILTQLKHVNIIKLFEVLDTPKSILLVMEYANGGELFSYVSQRNRLGEVEACRLFQQIISGVEYCHRAKIIHRDLKLENILLSSSNPSSSYPPTVKIADFGLSNSIKFGQKMDTSCGTPSYTCPEQLMGKKYIGNSADIWALGVILFAMISGFLPFESTNIPSLFKKIKNKQYKCPEYISREAVDLIDRMLTIDPDKRATIAEIRNHPWLLMEYTDLADQIEAQKPVMQEMVAEARAQCMAYGQNNENDTNNSSSSTTPSAGTAARNNKYAKLGSAGIKTGDKTSGGSASNPSQGDGSNSHLGNNSEDRDEGDDQPSPHSAGINNHSNNTAALHNHNNPHTHTNAAMGMGRGNARDRQNSANGSSGGNGVTIGAMNATSGNMNATSGGMGIGTRNGAKGFRERSTTTDRSSSPNASPTNHPPRAERARSIFDKLSLRTDPTHKSADVLSSNQPQRYPRFNPNPSYSDASSEKGGLKFPPITGTSPTPSPLPNDRPHRIGHHAPSSAASSNAPSSAAPTRTRRPSEFVSNSLPSYMQPTENAQNHLLASEREDREKAEETGTTRIRQRSVLLTSSPLAVKPAPSRMASVADSSEGGTHNLHPPTRGNTAAGVKSPRTRELSAMNAVPASRQRGASLASRNDL